MGYARLVGWEFSAKERTLLEFETAAA